VRRDSREIQQRGPIICSMQTEDDAGAVDPAPNPNGGYWHCYEGGVYRTNKTFASTNHVISLLGWGVSHFLIISVIFHWTDSVEFEDTVEFAPFLALL
jgi:hypothetical protein